MSGIIVLNSNFNDWFCNKYGEQPGPHGCTVSGARMNLFLTQTVVNRVCKTGRNKGQRISWSGKKPGGFV